ncbi:DNA-processing protein DprA [Tritonibacter mobilis]|uniref:DNA-processing protein DprA n=1 Tax=Tritonibacter mobilis TaxID=379347 RepID=UPI001401CBC8|nr:DNA-processing protein DprA [Tritonibacter mobilis]NHM19787.1 DNA-protecting protein DprA [Tritonibacter mobilis]NHM23936.1 DNA-protecting protein DprA [Tritonibacter mobilis]
MTGEAYSSTHPPLPPTTEDQRYSWLRLLRSRGIGTVTFYRLLAEYGSAQNVLEKLPEVAATSGVKGYKTYSKDALDAEFENAKAANARLLCFGDANYPSLLANIPNPPPALWAIGDLSLLARPAISIVGARNASSLGRRMAYGLARDLGEAGYLVVSGLARGIDASAHEGALGSGTIAVQGGGVDIIYPSENARLATALAEQGLRLSEQPMGLQPQARHFPPRNRIIAGLGLATIVVEAAIKSGSLITARDALDLGRDVMAVPGHPCDGRASGGNLLIRDGATLVRDARDVIDALPPMQMERAVRRPHINDLPSPPPERRSLRQTAALHQQILDRLAVAPTPEGQLIDDLDTPARKIRTVLTDLELSGEIGRGPGGVIIKKH